MPTEPDQTTDAIIRLCNLSAVDPNLADTSGKPIIRL